MMSPRLLFTTTLLAFAAAGCGSSPIDMGDMGGVGGGPNDGQGGGDVTGLGGASGGLGGTNGGLGGAIGGLGGSGPCVPPTGGVPTGGQNRFHYGINYAWASFGSDFGNTTRGVAAQRAQRLTSMMDMKAHGVDVVRWWVFPNFQGGGVAFDGAGAPTGLAGSTTADIAAALDVAAQAGVHIEFTFFSFDSFKINVSTTTVNPHNLAPLITDGAMRAAVINNIVVPFAQAVNQSANKDRVSSWDIINEPEWAIAATPTDGPDPAFTPQTTVTTVPYPVMRTFVSAVADALHANSDRPVTVGAAAVKWKKAWAGIGDFYTFHMYDWVNRDWPYTNTLASYGLTDKPVVMGEFPIQGLTGVSYLMMVNTFYDLGYAGVMAWAFNDRAFPWSPNNANVKTFADQHPCMFP
jgi:hypothetical protein